MATQRMMVSRATLLLAAIGTLWGDAPLQAQDLSFRAAVGPVIPADGTANRFAIGPAAMISADTRINPAWSLRWDAEWSLLKGRSFLAGQTRDLRTIGVSLSVVRRFSVDHALAPHLLVGIGAHRLQRVDAPTSRYGTTGAIQVGFGIDGKFRGPVAPFAEARAMLHLTDYASAELSPSVYCPILIGLRIR